MQTLHPYVQDDTAHKSMIAVKHVFSLSETAEITLYFTNDQSMVTLSTTLNMKHKCQHAHFISLPVCLKTLFFLYMHRLPLPIFLKPLHLYPFSECMIMIGQSWLCTGTITQVWAGDTGKGWRRKSSQNRRNRPGCLSGLADRWWYMG